MSTPSKALEALALRALKLKLKLEQAKAAFEEAQVDFIEQAEADGMLNPDTHAIGDVKTNITPNRFFDHDKAVTLVSEEALKAATVTVVDDKLLKQHMTPIQVEACMVSYPKPYKIGLAVNK